MMAHSAPYPSPAVVVKLGGSLITRKQRVSVFDWARTRRLAREIAAAERQTVIVHGTGSFGKPPAIQYGYVDSGHLPDSRGDVVAEVAQHLHVLRGHVLSCLLSTGLRPFGLAAASLYRTKSGCISHDHLTNVHTLLNRGMTPVICGDLVLDEDGGFAVCSSDAIAAHLAVHLKAERLVFATDSPVLVPTAGGTPQAAAVLHAENYLIVSEMTTGMSQDVSGGMSGKLAAGFEAAQAGIETLIVDGRVSGRLSRAIRGQVVPSTRLRAQLVED